MLTAISQPAFLRLPRTLPAALLPKPLLEHARQLWTGCVFAAQQAAGLPTAPHAAFKPYAIDAVTIQLPSPLPGVSMLVRGTRDKEWMAIAITSAELSCLHILRSATCVEVLLKRLGVHTVGWCRCHDALLVWRYCLAPAAEVTLRWA